MPVLRVYTERVMMERADRGAPELVEAEAPVLSLSFDYGNGGCVRAMQNREGDIASSIGLDLDLDLALDLDFDFQRNERAENSARCLLERFGAVDAACVDQVGLSPDSVADYLVRVDGDVHAHVAFSADALPALSALGWRVEVDTDYPYQCIARDPAFTARVVADEERPDWFGLELGVDVGGRSVDLLPALLSLLESSSDSQLSLAELEDRHRPVALPVGDGQHVAIDPGPLRALLRVLIELYETDTGLVVRGHRAVALEALDKVFAAHDTELRWSGDHKRARRRAKLLVDAPRARLEPAGLQATLRPYQREGLAWLQRLRASEAGGVLADDMGLGKTLQTIAHLQAEVAEGRGDLPTLVVAPTSLMGNWARELRRFAPALRVVAYHGPRRARRQGELADAHVVLTSYPILVRDEEILSTQPWHYAILDEAQVIKNPRSRAHKAACALESRHRLCLTGTPVENHLGELWSLFHFLDEDFLGPELLFRERYRTPIEQYGDDERLQSLQQTVAPFLLRRDKREVARDLPPKTQLSKPVELRGKQRELYEAIRIAAHTQVRSAIRDKGIAASTVTILDALTKLRQLCCDPRLVRMEAARFVRQSAKLEACMELMESELSTGHRILLFSQFTTMLDLIGHALQERGIGFSMLTGKSRDRQGLVDRFEAGETDVFLISLKAGGVGLNLTSADTVIHYDPWWNPQAQAQATDRAYRIGQQRPVFVHDLYIAGSVEERMLRLQDRKRRLADAILRGETSQGRFTENDVDQLFAPLG